MWACGYDAYGQCSGVPGGERSLWYPRLLSVLAASDVVAVAAGAAHTAVLSCPQSLVRATPPHLSRLIGFNPGLLVGIFQPEEGASPGPQALPTNRPRAAA